MLQLVNNSHKFKNITWDYLLNYNFEDCIDRLRKPVLFLSQTVIDNRSTELIAFKS